MNVYPGRHFPTSAPPVDMQPCISCGSDTTSALAEIEPICSKCEESDEVAAKDAALNGAFDVHLRRQVPVEHVLRSGRPFGLGFGEIPSSKITQALAEDQRGNPPVLGAFLAATTLATMVGLLVLAIAAVTG